MTFLNPAAFLLRFTIPVVVVLHLLKIRRPQATVSSTLLWADSLRDQQAAAPFRRLKPNLLLRLRDLTILSGGAAPAQPRQNFTRDRKKVRVWIEAWPSFLALGLLLFLPDVAIRRLRFHGAVGPGPTGRRE